MMHIPITRPYFDESEISMISDVLCTGWVSQGKKVSEFEKIVSKHERVAEAVATTSCTTALHLSMVALGLKSSMDVLVPSLTFVATANAVEQTGARAVPVDIELNTFNISIEQIYKTIENQYAFESNKLCNKFTGNVLWGIVPVHQFGLCCDMDSINQIASRYALQIVEDSACAIGASRQGIHPGGFGNVACTSFHPRKAITTGEGGMILTDDVDLATKLRALRTHGGVVSAEIREGNGGFLLPEYNEAGYNYRMTDIQGAMGIAQCKKLDSIIMYRRKAADIYRKLISRELPELIAPIEPGGYCHIYQSYVCMLDLESVKCSDVHVGGMFRNKIMQHLEEAGVSTRQGTHAIHTLGYYRKKYGFKEDDFPRAFEADRLSIALPLYYGITEEEQKYVIEQICAAISRVRRDCLEHS